MSTHLRPSILRQVHEALDKSQSYVNALDFTLEPGEGTLFISYNFNSKYYIRFDFSNKPQEYTESIEKTAPIFGGSTTSKITKKDHFIEGKMAPGELGVEEMFDFYGSHGIYRTIKNWIENFWEDLSSDPIIRQLMDQKNHLDTFLKQFDLDKISEGDQYFTTDEMTALDQRLKKVEEQLANELKQAITDKEELKNELEELQNEFKVLRQTMPNLSKKGWVKSMFSKLYIWSSKKDNQKLIKATANYGKSLLDVAKEIEV